MKCGELIQGNSFGSDTFFELEQPLISKKDKHNVFSVEREYVNSKAYHDKFEQEPVKF